MDERPPIDDARDPQKEPGRATFRRRVVLAVAVAVVAVGAGALVGVFRTLTGTGDVLASKIPADATVYVTAYLDPAAAQKLNLGRLADRFPALADRSELDRRINEALDRVLAEGGLTASEVRSWLGSQVAVAVRLRLGEPRVTVLLDAEDERAAAATLASLRGDPDRSQRWEDQDHRGVTVSTGTRDGHRVAYALFDGTVVVANHPDPVRQSIDAFLGAAPALSSSDRFVRATESLPEERLGLLFVDLGAIVQDLRRAMAAAPLPLLELPGLADSDALLGLAGVLRAEPAGIEAQMALAVDPDEVTAEQRRELEEGTRESDALAFTPRQAYGLLALRGLGSDLRTTLGQLRRGIPDFSGLEEELGLGDALEHLTGDVGMEVGPGTAPIPAGAVLIGTDDEAAMSAFLDRAAGLASRSLPRSGAAPRHWLEEEHDGVRISYLADEELGRLGVEPAYAVSQGMAIVASSRSELKAILEARASGENITSAPNFREAAGPEDPVGAVLYLDLEAIVSAIRTALPADRVAEFDRGAGEILAPMKAFLASGRGDMDHPGFRIFLVIR